MILFSILWLGLLPCPIHFCFTLYHYTLKLFFFFFPAVVIWLLPVMLWLLSYSQMLLPACFGPLVLIWGFSSKVRWRTFYWNELIELGLLVLFINRKIRNWKPREIIHDGNWTVYATNLLSQHIQLLDKPTAPPTALKLYFLCCWRLTANTHPKIICWHTRLAM